MNATPELMDASLKMLTALIVVVGLMLVVWMVMKKLVHHNDGHVQGHRISVLANRCVGMKKHISLVQVPGVILVLGITNERITCLTKIRQEDWPEPDSASPGRPPAASFLGQLKGEIVGLRSKSQC